jgi:hypothetical protein
MASNQIEFGRTRSTGLVEVLDRILDKGLFVGGDIKISLAEVELLTIRIRLIVCSLDKAREIGLDWWMYDRHLSPGPGRDGGPRSPGAADCGARAAARRGNRDQHGAAGEDSQGSASRAAARVTLTSSGVNNAR